MTTAADHLISAIEGGRTDIVRSIISAYESDDVTEDEFTLDRLLTSQLTDSGTLLHLATKLEQVDVVRALLSAGADAGIRNADGQTALDLSQDLRIQEVFNGALLQSVASSNVDRVGQLLAAGVDINTLDSDISKNTSLHWAACYGTVQVVECLCGRGANVNALNTDGVSSLIDAVNRGEVGVVKVLLRHGADPNMTAISGKFAGQSAADLAKEKPELADVFTKCTDKELVISNGIVQNGSILQADVAVNGLDLNSTTMLLDASIACESTHSGISKDSLPTELVAEEDKQTSVNSVISDSQTAKQPLDLLWPKPSRVLVKEGAGSFRPENKLHVFISTETGGTSEMFTLWQRHSERLEAIRLCLAIETLSDMPADKPCVACQLSAHTFSQTDSYRLSVTANQVKLIASDLCGMFYGINTFIQLLRLYTDSGVPSLQIYDNPCLRYRGVMLDFVKGRISLLDHMRNLIRTLSFLKINQIQLYTRFEMRQDAEWQFPYTRSELLELNSFCRLYFITLSPVVDVCPAVCLSDVAQLQRPISAFLDCFPNLPVVSVGPRLSAFILQSDMTVVPRLLPVCRHVTLQLCAFPLVSSTLDSLPFSVTLAEYGFQADYDFQKNCQLYANAGIPFVVVPGTAAWNSLAGCPEAAVANICNAAQQALAYDALGLVVCHWSGLSHMTHQSFMWPGLLIAAGLAWNSNVTLDFLHSSLADLLNWHVFDDTASCVGQVIIELGRAETYLLKSSQPAGGDSCQLPATNASNLQRLLSQPDDVALEFLTPEIFQTMRHIRKCQAELSRQQLLCEYSRQVCCELALTCDLMLAACRVGRALVSAGKRPMGDHGYAVVNLGVANLPPTTRTDLANKVLSLRECYEKVWLGRHLDVGLADSLRDLSTMLSQFVPRDSGVNTSVIYRQHTSSK